MTQRTDESEIRGHEQRAKQEAARNTRDLPSRIADPDRLRALAEEMRAIAERPTPPPTGDASPVIRGLESLIVLHEEKHRRVVVHMATVLEACALRIQELEAAVREPMGEEAKL
jgi:hypothetical protein